jgi:NAD(P)H-dependent FMN reductase
MYLIFSTSHNPGSRSRAMAQYAEKSFQRLELPCQLIDLAQMNLPECDGDACYEHPTVMPLRELIGAAKAVLIASPIYNYDVGSAAKKLVELTGNAWENKIVGFLAAAGGSTSFMAVMSFANSLMLDFHTLVVPRFVYASEESFDGLEISDPGVTSRIDTLVAEVRRLASALDDTP